MPSLRTIIEFQESLCRVFIWEAAKGSYVLKTYVGFGTEKSVGEKTEGAERDASIQNNAAALRQALRATGHKIAEAVVVIPKQWVTVRSVTLPSTDPAELGEMARFEAQRYIPFNVERHIISHHVVRMEGLNGSRVLVAAIDGPQAEEIVETMNVAGIHISALDVSTVALVNALLNSGQWNSEANPTVAHIEVGQSATDINILHKGCPIFARSISHGVDKLFVSGAPDEKPEAVTLERIEAVDLLRSVDKENPPSVATPESTTNVTHLGAAQVPHLWVERLVNEIRRTYDFARREFECDPLTQVFISGVGASLRNLDQVLMSNLGSEPIVLAPFAGTLQMDAESLPDSQKPCAYAAGAGGILREAWDKSLRINLLPPMYIRKHLTTQRKQSLMVTGSLALVLLICAAVFASLLVTRRQRELRFFEKEIAATKERAKEIRYRKAVIRILKSNTSQQGSALAVLNTLSGYTDLFNQANMEVCIESFVYKAEGSVVLAGYAVDHQTLYDFVARLDASKHFSKVRVDEMPPIVLPGKAEEVLKFQITCVFPQKGAGSN